MRVDDGITGSAGACDALAADARQRASRQAAPGYRRRGRDVRERPQHERALVHARMRHDEPGHAHAAPAEE